MIVVGLALFALRRDLFSVMADETEIGETGKQASAVLLEAESALAFWMTRLVKARHPLEEFGPNTPADKQATTYVLDAAGNILRDRDYEYAYSVNRVMQKATPPALVNGEIQPGSVVEDYGYDSVGNLAWQGTQSDYTQHHYDAAGHPLASFTDHVVDPELPLIVPVAGADYAYDAFGRIVWRSDPESGDATLFFHDRDRDIIALETTATGSTTTRYVFDSTGVQVGQQQVTPNKGFGWYVTDLRGNLTQLLDDTSGAAVKAVYNYDPFGQAKAGLTAEASGWSSRLRYQMAPRDPATGRYHLGPRLYDPGINRFLGADHYLAAAANLALALDPLTGNRYMYAGANPAGMVDDGHSPSGMNEAEWDYCRWPSRWKLCRQVSQIRDRVRADEVRRFPGDYARRNAYRHCCWSAEMTIRLGENTARGFLDRHEHGADRNDPDHKADLRNNESGIHIAHSTRGTANERVAQAEWACYRAAAEGRLVLVG